MSVLEIINGNTKKENKIFTLPIKVTPMNASQEQALKEVEKNTLTNPYSLLNERINKAIRGLEEIKNKLN